MTHKTRGIVLRNVKYGDSSLVVTVFTELFGIQTYLVNGARTAGKKGNTAALYQPASILHLEAYHHPQKNMHRIRESSRAILYEHVQSNVIKNSIALFVVEMLHKLLRQPEKQEDLYYFCEDLLVNLDRAVPSVVANLPLFFCLQLSPFFGFRLQDAAPGRMRAEEVYLDLEEGCFTDTQPSHQNYLSTALALHSMDLLKVQHPDELSQIQLTQQQRRNLLKAYISFYAIHIPDFTALKSISILETVLSVG
jgi:DNA repair protein RecO (recombination protein O)